MYMFQDDAGNFEFTAETLEHLTPTAGHFELTSGTFELTPMCLDIVSSDDLMGGSGNEFSLRHATMCGLHKQFLPIPPNNISETKEGIKICSVLVLI